MSTAINYNLALNGIELSFDARPADGIRAALKNNGFRWHKAKGIWYAKYTEARDEIAKSIAAGKTLPESETTPDTSDWGGVFDAAGGYMGGGSWRGSKSAHYMTGAELNKAIRADLKDHGITGVSLKKSGYSSISVTITAADTDLTPEGLAECDSWGIQVNQYAIDKYADKFKPGFLAKVKAVNECVNSYRYDESNAMVDYFCSNFYYSITVKRASR